MRAGRGCRAVRVILATAALMLLVGCRVPGGSFGGEPLQLRFAEMTRRAAEVEEARAADRRPILSTSIEPVVLAGHAQP